MGTDKALIPFRGQPLIRRVIERVQPLADELFVITNSPEAYRFLNLPLVSDTVEGRGALGGLYTALSQASETLVAVVACDMPFVSRGLLSACRDALVEQDWDAAIPRTGLGFEPFHSVYRRAACLEMVKAALNEGRWRVDSWFAQARIRYFEPQEVLQFDPLGQAFINLNTPEDVERAEALVRFHPDER